MTVLPVNNIINVTITNTPSGLSERNVNSLALFTTESPSGISTYETFISAAQVADEYGTSSVTAAMANAIFAQSPNIRSGDGRLVVIPLLSSVSATSGDFTTADISSNLSDILDVTDGDLEVSIDGTDVELTGLDFTQADDLADVATILDNALANVIVTAPTANTLKFLSKKVGDDADVTIGAVSGGSGTDLAGAGYFNSAGGTATSGADATGETIADAISRIDGSVSFAGVITNLEMEDDVLTALATAIQAQDRIFLHHVCSVADITGGVGNTIQQAGNTKTRILGYTESLSAANLYKAAYAGRAFSVNYNGNATSQTMNLKQLAGVTPDAGITQTIYGNADTNGVDLYVSFDGVPSVHSTEGNDFFDNIYADLALKFALETAGFNYLRQTNTKVPQTETGMNGLKGAYAQVLERFVRVNSVAAGSWTSSETFGDPETFRQNILERGFYVFSEPVTQQSAAEREAREAPLVQIAVKRSGAVHTSDVIVLVND